MKPVFTLLAPLIFTFSFLIFNSTAFAQEKDIPQVGSVKFHRTGDQTSFPAIEMNSQGGLELMFDALDGKIRNYYYSFVLCNYDWTPSMLTPFEYIKGFQSIRINTYRNSSLAFTRYVHYSASVPDRNCYPSRSGNYLLRVFLDGDTSKTVFTRRFVVYGTGAEIGAKMQQPLSARIFRTYQRLYLTVKTQPQVRVFTPSDIKVVVLQNDNWETSITMDRPTIARGNYYEYADDVSSSLPGLREFRWADLRSFRLKSDRVSTIQSKGDTTHVVMKPDAIRSGQPYLFYNDLNGHYIVEALESINPYWQADYGYVTFSYQPLTPQQLAGKDLYLFGEFTNYGKDEKAKMQFNEETGKYETTLFLKQGYYNYLYATKENNYPDFSALEGDFWNSENDYTVLIYYKPFGSRSEEIIGISTINYADGRNRF